jgi:hypothetical protein
VPHDFDYVFDFQTSYVYDPQQGNLLVEFIVANGVPPTNTWQDATDSESRLVFALADDAEVANITLDEITVKQFTIIPEPTTILLTILGMASVCCCRRRCNTSNPID